MSQEAFEIQPDETEESLVTPGRQRNIAFSDAQPGLDEDADKPRKLPEFVQKNFLEVDGQFYFQNREPAFSFKNDELRTKSTSPEVVKAIVEIAKDQEWGTLNVSGNKNFRRAVWLEATAQGIDVSGYSPTEVEKAQAARMAERLQARGLTNENTVTPGAREVAKEQTPPRAEPQQGTKAPKEGERAEEKAKAFQNGDKPEVLKEFPDLAKGYATLSVAEMFAKKNLPADKAESFVQGIKSKYAEKIQNNEPLPGPTVKRSSVLKLHEQAQARELQAEPINPAPVAPKAAERPIPAQQRMPQAEPVKPAPAAPDAVERPVKVQDRIAALGKQPYTPLDAGYAGSYLSNDEKARTFTGMLRQGGLSPERAILIAEVSKLKEGLDPKGFAQDMAENKRMFESLATEPTQEKCRVLAMMYEERLAKLRYNEHGEVNHEISKALFNRQSKIREGLEQRKEAQLLEASKRPAPLVQRPVDPSAPSKTVDLENREQFVAYLSRGGVERENAEKLYSERQNRKITEPRSYAREIEYERTQIAEMRSITRSPTKTDEEKAEDLNKFVATNIIRNSDAAKDRDNQERGKFVELMEQNGIKSERAQVIYEARKIQKEIDPEQYAREQNQLKNIASQCKAEGVTPAESEKRISQMLSTQYDNLKVRASRDTMARDIVTAAGNARIEQIRQQQKDREKDRMEQQERERSQQQPQRTSSRTRDRGPSR